MTLHALIERLEVAIKNNQPVASRIARPGILLSALRELNDSIGNARVKDSVAQQLTYLLSESQDSRPMLNTVLYGPPGVGKTRIGSLLAKVWYGLGAIKKREQAPLPPSKRVKEMFTAESASTNINIIYLVVAVVFILLSLIRAARATFGPRVSNFIFVAITIFLTLAALYYFRPVPENPEEEEEKQTDEVKNVANDEDIIKIVTRQDLVGKYVGWSDKQTKEVLIAALGKVLFIDEAYSLYSGERDMYGGEVINTINQFLSEHPGEIIVIMAGYRDKLEDGLFAAQPGLARRFMWKFECNGYTVEELFEIFKYQAAKAKTPVKPSDAKRIKQLFLEAGQSSFPAYAGDTERLVFFSGLSRSSRFLHLTEGEMDKYINYEDVTFALKKLEENHFEQSSEKPDRPTLARLMNDLITH